MSLNNYTVLIKSSSRIALRGQMLKIYNHFDRFGGSLQMITIDYMGGGHKKHKKVIMKYWNRHLYTSTIFINH